MAYLVHEIILNCCSGFRNYYLHFTYKYLRQIGTQCYNNLMSKELRVIGYVRVSTHIQSTDFQRAEIGEYVQARGWTNVTILEDQATGTNEQRPALRELLAQVKLRKVDVVVVWKLDRLFRSLRHLVTTLQEFNDCGVQFVSLRDQIDMTSAAGRLLIHLLGAFAEFEAGLIHKHVIAGLAAAKKKGFKLGRPISVPTKAIVDLRGKGLSMSVIAVQLGISKSAVSKTLSKVARETVENTGTQTVENEVE